ncbi:asparagine synthase (glutamine-hydrolyzing) [Polaribacter sp. SA4-12]|uniref:asparagine synthase (glutamine-hydrolyzing) n=1 Tax=Polaribacter sp. SA4-12 TaxID=1312072 RepID=UPI000B3D29C1|nr:asparagine synthase (glutamine-hydrolyzing) [Polaribacter sp. SA4-12]ARV13798.1 asparagine synthase (glutamine-hydrolyzing) [Polaribacter sp. SA4-12]
MCGINAFFSYQKINNSIISRLKSCNADMIYRGPNEQDVWYNNKMALGQVRLSIIGVDNGHQPLFNEDKSLVLVCNGEIYNYKELKSDLIGKGHHFSSETDSEVILHLYEEYPENFNDKLEGMFAYCLYDINKEKLIVGRDIAGKKPLYYAKTDEGIIFSSEVKVIKKYFLKNPSLNLEVLRQTQKFSYSISPNTTYVNDILKLPYASYATISVDKGYNIDVKRYFKRNINPTFGGSYEEACLEIKRLLYKAVEKRLQSEVPVGILLSAGIDSSAIAAITKEFKEDVSVLSAGYKGNHEVDERREAKKFSNLKGFKWNEIELDENNFNGKFTKIMSILDEPNGDVAMFAQWEIYKKAKELGFTVLLSGNGGDELFYGYKSHNDFALGLDWTNTQKNKMPLRSKKVISKHYIYQIFKLLVSKIDNPLNKINIRNDYPLFDELEKSAFEQSLPLDRNDWHRVDYKDYIDKVYYYLNYAWLTNNCYFLADKLAMANSIEVRSPFADIELIKFVDTLPLEYKFRNQQPKQILKDSLKGVLPVYVLNREKSGFTPPTSFINNIVSNYKSSYFNEHPRTYAQLVTDYFAKTI